MADPTLAMLRSGGASYDHPSVYMGGASQGGMRKSKSIYTAMLEEALE